MKEKDYNYLLGDQEVPQIYQGYDFYYNGWHRFCRPQCHQPARVLIQL